GGIIIYPTETLYGLGALAVYEDSVAKVFNIKGRLQGKPIPILVRDKEMLSEFAVVTDEAVRLIEKFLPGPLTLVLEQKRKLPYLISAGTGKIAIRISSHRFVKRLFDFLSDPITSTSANISGQENIFSFNEIYETFNSKVELIVDSGTLPRSKGSTVIDLTAKPAEIIREGDISGAILKEFIHL
ncbi:MAG: threonylcarbamoyl-AMP synthase, partial [Candidatus Dadabacteria bacterium]|nr:threonylcarbamoyl-AMP synthase [Candidatus Dadabacteria bacterium]